MRGLRRRMRQQFAEFFAEESSSGIILIAAAAIALVLANSPLSGQFGSFLETKIGADFSGIHLNLSVGHWINDGLMAVFFFVVGLEIKREILIGELSNRERATLPIAAAIGGMAVPALIYAAICRGKPEVVGWGIPMATDIAFSLGILALLGSRVPIALKVFLAALAIVDDIGAVLVIAMFYSGGIAWGWLGGGVAIVAFLIVLNRLRIQAMWPYIAGGALVWVCILQSGVHATIAGVLVAFTIPATAPDSDDASPLERLEDFLHPVQTYGIVPIFALANAGVSLAGVHLSQLTSGVPLGVILGLAIGKPVGILAFSWLAIKAKLSELPTQTSWRQIAGVGLLAGIGFTMSLFVAELAFGDGAALDEAKLGILSGSLVSAVIGFFVLRKDPRIRSANG